MKPAHFILAACAAALYAAPALAQEVVLTGATPENLTYQRFRSWLRDGSQVWMVMGGDSISESYNTRYPRRNSWFATLCARLKGGFGDAGVYVDAAWNETRGGGALYVPGTPYPWGGGQWPASGSPTTPGWETNERLWVASKGVDGFQFWTAKPAGWYIGTGGTGLYEYRAYSTAKLYVDMPPSHTADLVFARSARNATPDMRAFVEGTETVIPTGDASLVRASARVDVQNGMIQSPLTITNPGAGYDSPPIVTFRDTGAGAGATATATLDAKTGKVTGVTVAGGGNGQYAATTRVVLTAPLRYNQVARLNPPPGYEYGPREVALLAGTSTEGDFAHMEGVLCRNDVRGGIVEMNVSLRGAQMGHLSTTSEGYFRNYWGMGSASQMIQPSDKAALWLALSTNDYVADGRDGTYDPAFFVNRCVAVANRLRTLTTDNGKTAPVFLVVPPMYDPRPEPTHLYGYTLAGSAAFRQVYPDAVIVDAARAFGDGANARARNWFGRHLYGTGYDNTHPTAQGNAKWATEVLTAMDLMRLAPPNTMADAYRALAIASGGAADAETAARLDVATQGLSRGHVDLLDAVALARRAARLDANP